MVNNRVQHLELKYRGFNIKIEIDPWAQKYGTTHSAHIGDGKLITGSSMEELKDQVDEYIIMRLTPARRKGRTRMKTKIEIRHTEEPPATIILVDGVHSQTLDAIVNHFCGLYMEEITTGEVSRDTIHEWWNYTKDQYNYANYEAIEGAILQVIS